MIIVRRVATGVASHFKARFGEWISALILLNWGLVLSCLGPIFDRPAMAWLAEIGGQQQWGVACYSIGLARTLALVLNGTFAGTPWSRFSPHVRALMSVLSCLVWTSVSLSVLSQSDISQIGIGLAVYPVLALTDLFSCACASLDARNSDEVHRYGRAAR
ncbi:hypothetical protein K32_23820 [Kaistia sp. 32K]|uniref:hypothetical protein n=1 Tax=Kaistia sp. 32K TaxID=2795690 RepID=UPI001915A017|nr:hypothetical protein [Kaistia sp. 32K]BCP53765.1 hypothetical protein K32_23820 [Kaistia sp. 32K]